MSMLAIIFAIGLMGLSLTSFYINLGSSKDAEKHIHHEVCASYKHLRSNCVCCSSVHMRLFMWLLIFWADKYDKK